MSEIGHNSNNGGTLKSFVERIERLEEDKAAVQADIREVYSEAKGSGYEVKVIRKIIRERGLSEQERRERDELMELYKSALGME